MAPEDEPVRQHFLSSLTAAETLFKVTLTTFLSLFSFLFFFFHCWVFSLSSLLHPFIPPPSPHCSFLSSFFFTGLNFLCLDSDLCCLPSTVPPSLAFLFFCSCRPTVPSVFPTPPCPVAWLPVPVFRPVCFVRRLRVVSTARPLGQPVLEAAAQSQRPQSDSPAPGPVAPPHPATRTDAARRCSR